MVGSEKLAVHHGFPESGTASARGTANSQGARPIANLSLSQNGYKHVEMFEMFEMFETFDEFLLAAHVLASVQFRAVATLISVSSKCTKIATSIIMER